MSTSFFLVLWVVLLLPMTSVAAPFPEGFILGVANAPGQVEDNLSDIWMDWGKQGNIRTWTQTKAPEERIKFWTKPEIELNLAQELGANSFRLGVDWGRVMPRKNQFDDQSLLHY